MTIVGLHHVQINVPVTGEDEARRFYEAVLGFAPMPRPTSLSDAGRAGAWYRCGDSEFHVFFNPSAEFVNDGSSRHPAFLVDELPELRQRLSDAGIQLEEAIPINGRERFFCRDPFGNRLEFLTFA